MLASQNKMVSSTNNKCEIDNPPFSSFPTLTPLTRPSSYILLDILLRSPIIRIKSKGDNGSLCHNPLEVPKNPREPLTKIETCTMVNACTKLILNYFVNPFFFMFILGFNASFFKNQIRILLFKNFCYL